MLVTDESPADTTKDGDHGVISGAAHPTFDRDRHYLYVLGASAPEIVGCAGGWLFDRAMAGWDVTVFVRDFHQAWPLRILGVAADDYGSAVAAVEGCPGRRALAFAAEAYDDDASVRELVRNALEDRSCEVTVWGDVGPTGVGAHLARFSHRLGPAAAAFKKHALAAAGSDAVDAEGAEVLYSNDSNYARSAQRAIVHTSAPSSVGATRGRVTL